MLSKKQLRKGVEQFRRQFGDQPTQALGSVLPTAELQRLVVEEVGASHFDPSIQGIGLACALPSERRTRDNRGTLGDFAEDHMAYSRGGFKFQVQQVDDDVRRSRTTLA